MNPKFAYSQCRGVKPRNAYIQSLTAGAYAAVSYDPASRRILGALPAGFVPDPPEQVEATVDGRLFVVYAGADMPGWLLRANRVAAGLRQADLGALIGVSGTTIGGYESDSRPIPRRFTRVVYHALLIDHRPIALTPDSIRRTYRYLRMPVTALAPILGVSPEQMRALADGTMIPTDALAIRFYALYCMLPDLTQWPL